MDERGPKGGERTTAVARALAAARIGALVLSWALAASADALGATPSRSAEPGAAIVPAAEAPAGSLGAQGSLLERAWREPGDLADRVARTRRASLALGAWSYDVAARSLAAGDGGAVSAVERDAAAVALAPDLPSAHMRHARSLWLHGGAPFAAAGAAARAFGAIGRHPEASFWFAGCALYLLAVALVAGGLLAVTLAGLGALAHAAHDLGHLVSRSLPAFASAAALAALLFVPLALGEGVLGLALTLLGVAAIYGGRGRRLAMLFAIGSVGVGAYPVARHAGIALAAFREDPVAQAAAAVGHGVATPVELARLDAAADADPMAVRALAIDARRRGDLAAADALYQRLLASGADDVAALNNAANVRFDRGEIPAAIEIYEQAAAAHRSPVVHFNLAQAYGRTFRVEDLNRMVTEGQRLDRELFAHLTAVQSGNEGFVIDLPIAPSLFWSRALRSGAGSDLAAQLRASFAPGRLGRDPAAFAAVATAALVLATALAARGRSRGCKRCGRRMCPRCDRQQAPGELCDGCHKLFFEPEKTDRTLRAKRVEELRVREQRVARVRTAISLLVPGAAGVLTGRPVLSWLGATTFALIVAAVVWRGGVVPDPLVAGAAGPAVFLGVGALSAVAYALVVWSSIASREPQ